ncbi:MAG: hypothetical protein GY953_35990, partial [bacterium]|nr:hypothetical protein [bacterium]
MALPPKKKLRDLLEDQVTSFFRSAKAAPPTDGSVPEVVLENRRKRAEIRPLDALVTRGSPNLPRDLTKEATTLVRDWAKASFVDGFQPVDEFEIQCARDHDLVVAEESGDVERVLDVLERDYRRDIEEQYGSIELSGIQVSHRVYERLEEVFVPLHLEPIPIFDKDQAAALLVRPRQPFSEVLRDHRHVLIIGSPGSGKSTLVAYLASRCARGELSGD